jgi:UDP-2,3-diacylglucosamine pyrophosphatase LpxH
MVFIRGKAAVKSAEENSGTVKAPFVVVSDVHLGGEKSNDKDFRNFLFWLTTLTVDGQAFTCDGENLTIKRPGTIVLLGDILELWDPEDDDRNNVLTDVLEPLMILNDLGCDIIYVIGNHDEDLLDFKRVWRKKNGAFPSNGSFDIVFRSYPRKIAGTEEIKGLQIGGKTYSFLHGQQFDHSQVFYKLSKFLSRKLGRQVRFDPIDWHQDLTNVSFTKNVGRKRGNTVILGVLVILYLAGYIFWFKDIPLGSGWGIFWVIISSFFIATILPKVVTWSSTKIWGWVLRTKKCSSVEEVIQERYNEEKGKFIDADIIVFGHTHNPGNYYSKAKKRLFINTGSWVKECAAEKRNVFLYIDTDAPYLLTWSKEKVANGELTCLEDLREVLRN